MGNFRGLVLGVASLLLACEAPHAAGPRFHASGPTSLVLIHTADLHSHLFPERQLLGEVDAARGLGPAGAVAEVGGFAKISSIVSDMRAGADHCLYLDSGDLIEGTAAFTEFGGEPELRAFSALHLDAAALGNHDLDPGAQDFADKHRQFATFPVLASNIRNNGSELAAALAESAVLDASGIRVGVIGIANPSSPSGLARADNPYGIELVATASAVQAQIDRLRSRVDLIVAISHLGLEGDEALIRGTSGLDVVLGGHQHLTLDAALERSDCGAALSTVRGCQARRVFLVHSGALGRYVGEVDLSLVPASSGAEQGLVVSSAFHTLVAVSAQVPEDPALAALLEPYHAALHAAGFDTKLAFALGEVERYGSNGGDSALGNLIADAIRENTGADLAIVNTTGIRADLPPGELTRAELVAALPLGDTLTVLSISGAQLRTLLVQQARIASSRKCQSPIQISGFDLELKCSGTTSSATLRRVGSSAELDAHTTYTLATSAYLANGGSGFEALAGISARRALSTDPLDALLDALHELPSCAQSRLPCIAPAALRDGRIIAHAP